MCADYSVETFTLAHCVVHVHFPSITFREDCGCTTDVQEVLRRLLRLCPSHCKVHFPSPFPSRLNKNVLLMYKKYWKGCLGCVHLTVKYTFTPISFSAEKMHYGYTRCAETVAKVVPSPLCSTLSFPWPWSLWPYNHVLAVWPCSSHMTMIILAIWPCCEHMTVSWPYNHFLAVWPCPGHMTKSWPYDHVLAIQPFSGHVTMFWSYPYEHILARWPCPGHMTMFKNGPGPLGLVYTRV